MQVKEKMAEEKDEEMRTLKITWAANNDTALAAARKKWLKEQEEEITRKVQSQVSAQQSPKTAFLTGALRDTK